MEKLSKISETERAYCMMNSLNGEVDYACWQIDTLDNTALGINRWSPQWRRDLDAVRQEVDQVCGRCQTFTSRNAKGMNVNKPDVDNIPCQRLRKNIMLELGGVWI